MTETKTKTETECVLRERVIQMILSGALPLHPPADPAERDAAIAGAFKSSLKTKSKTDYYYESLLEAWKDDGRCSNEEALSCLTDPDLTVEGVRRMFDDYVDSHPEGPLTDAEVWEVHRRLVEYYEALVKSDLYYDQCVKNWEVEGNDWRKDAVFLKELHGNLDVTGWTQTFEDQFPEGERPEGPLTPAEVIALVKRLRERFPWEGEDE